MNDTRNRSGRFSSTPPSVKYVPKKAIFLPDNNGGSSSTRHSEVEYVFVEQRQDDIAKTAVDADRLRERRIRKRIQRLIND